MKVRTDYPLYKHEYGKKAPIRVVTIVDYDANKYCKVMYDGETYSVKRGYLYVNSRKIAVSHQTLCRIFKKEP